MNKQYEQLCKAFQQATILKVALGQASKSEAELLLQADLTQDQQEILVNAIKKKIIKLPQYGSPGSVYKALISKITDANLLRDIANSNQPLIRIQVLNHPNPPADVIEALRNDKDNKVRLAAQQTFIDKDDATTQRRLKLKRCRVPGSAFKIAPNKPDKEDLAIIKDIIIKFIKNGQNGSQWRNRPWSIDELKYCDKTLLKQPDIDKFLNRTPIRNNLITEHNTTWKQEYQQAKTIYDYYLACFEKLANKIKDATCKEFYNRYTTQAQNYSSTFAIKYCNLKYSINKGKELQVDLNGNLVVSQYWSKELSQIRSDIYRISAEELGIIIAKQPSFANALRHCDKLALLLFHNQLPDEILQSNNIQLYQKIIAAYQHHEERWKAQQIKKGNRLDNYTTRSYW